MIFNELENIIDDIVPEEDPPFFTDSDTEYCIEMCLELMNEYIMDDPSAIADPDFNDILMDDITEIMLVHFEYLLHDTLSDREDELEDDIEEISTLLLLRNEVLMLHLGFSLADSLSTLISGMSAKGSTITQTSDLSLAS